MSLPPILTRIAAIINIVISLLLLGLQIALYASDWYGYSDWFVHLSIGIWGAITITLASVAVLINENHKDELKSIMCGLSAIVGIVIIGVFSSSINNITQNTSISASCSQLTETCSLLAIDSLFIISGCISTLLSIFLMVESVTRFNTSFWPA